MTREQAFEQAATRLLGYSEAVTDAEFAVLASLIDSVAYIASKRGGRLAEAKRMFGFDGDGDTLLRMYED